LAVDTDLEPVADGDGRPVSETQAEAFATQQLIPSEQLDQFVARVRPAYSPETIGEFARTLGVHPGVVVGQLQYRGELAWAQLRKLLVPIRHLITATAVTDGWGVRISRGPAAG
jgi:HTH-type transcriptional regulator/antitoxin HigA